MGPDFGSRRTFLKLAGAAATAAILHDDAASAESLAGASSPAQEFVEIVGALGHTSLISSLVALKDGSLLSNDGRLSTDGGKTWKPSRSFGEGVSAAGIMRLKSGQLALASQVGYGAGKVWLSGDEGQSWALAGPISVPGGPVYELGDTMVQLDNGRLLYCWDYNMAGNHPGLAYLEASSFGTWKGHRYQVEGHGHLPEFFASGFSWSDDLGKTWKIGEFSSEMPNILMGWFDETGEPNGKYGITPAGEACLAPTADGRVLYFGRSTVGRIVSSYSADGGQTWTALRPTELAASNSPPRLRRIPGTDDLLCVWNQVSGDEIRAGFRRGRLSAAISKDNGATWSNFKTIERTGGLDQSPRVTPDKDILLVRARKDVGKLPDDYAYFHYANVCFVGDNVYVVYLRGYPESGVAEQLLNKQECVLRIYPLKWFYS